MYCYTSCYYLRTDTFSVDGDKHLPTIIYVFRKRLSPIAHECFSLISLKKSLCEHISINSLCTGASRIVTNDDNIESSTDTNQQFVIARAIYLCPLFTHVNVIAPYKKVSCVLCILLQFRIDVFAYSNDSQRQSIKKASISQCI